MLSGAVAHSTEVTGTHSNSLTGVFFSIYYAMTGLHAIHILAGMGAMVWLLRRALRNEFGPGYFGPVDYVALYWHLVDLVWIYLVSLALPDSVNACPLQVASHPGDLTSHDSHLSHVMSPRVLLTVFGVLVALTVLTVAAAQVSFGAWEVWVSLGIASVKATLVAVYFMHLRHDKSLHGILFLSSLLFAALFLALTLMDLQVPSI